MITDVKEFKDVVLGIIRMKTGWGRVELEERINSAYTRFIERKLIPRETEEDPEVPL